MTEGAPDALVLGAPPDPDPLDNSNPALYDYSSDIGQRRPPKQTRGCRFSRDITSGCHYEPTAPDYVAARVHRWVTDPLPATLEMNGKVTLEFYTRTLNDALSLGKLCVYLFDLAEDETSTTMLEDKTTGNFFWTYEPEGNGYWPRNSWTKVRLPMEFEPTPIAAGHRLGIALSVEPANTDVSEAIPIVYDHPNYPTRIEVDTTTPIEGG